MRISFQFAKSADDQKPTTVRLAEPPLIRLEEMNKPELMSIFLTWLLWLILVLLFILTLPQWAFEYYDYPDSYCQLFNWDRMFI